MKELEKIATFRKELAVAETIEEVKAHETAAEAIAHWAKITKQSKDKQNELGMFRIEIEEKKGLMLEKFYPRGRPKEKSSTTSNFNSSMKELGIKPDESARARTLAHLPEEVKTEIVQEIIEKDEVVTPNMVYKRAKAKVKKEEREREIEEQRERIPEATEIPDTFDIVVIDPPWPYGRRYDPDGSRIANPYPEMSLEEIKNITIPANEDSIMFLWTTHKFLPDSFELLKEWGFTYKATMVWDKEKLGMGFWLRMQAEFCLLAVKGSPSWQVTDWRDIIREPRREHSRKPDSFYDAIDKYFPADTKIDYFSRKERPGWVVFGNDINKF